MGVPTTHDGVAGLLSLPGFADIDIVFDATSAKAHEANAKALAPHGKRLVDLTPAAIGPFVVPAVNLGEHLDAVNVNMVTCGGQATIPVVAAVSSVTEVAYAEIVASIASRSAGPGTRANIDEFTETTARAIEQVGGARRGKAVIVLNPAEPPLIMRDTVFCLVSTVDDQDRIRRSVREMVDVVAGYVPGYRLKQDVQITEIPKDQPVHTLTGGRPVTHQVERDLAGEPPEVWEATRARIATEGFGARLLALQDPDGRWAGGAFFPSDAQDGDDQPRTATTWTLSSLREWGLDATVLRERRTAELLAENCRWEYDDLPYWDGEVDCCINAWTVANGLWLGADITGIVDWFLEHQLPDGGWNCQWVDGSTRSSFHSTLNSLKGLLAHDLATGGTDATRAARRTGEEYLLRRGLFRRLSTGEPVAPWVDCFAYPFRWFYSVLNAAEYFREAGPPDPRMADAIDLIRAARQPDGTWLQAPRTGVVRGRRTGRRAVEVADPVRDTRPRLVGLTPEVNARVLKGWYTENVKS
jgi:acetaldehyde dehydrogenase (acetylating)